VGHSGGQLVDHLYLGIFLPPVFFMAALGHIPAQQQDLITTRRIWQQRGGNTKIPHLPAASAAVNAELHRLAAGAQHSIRPSRQTGRDAAN